VDHPPRPEHVGLPADWLVVMPAGGHVMYRMVKAEQAIKDDFRSDRLLGRPRYGDDLEADHLGLSMFEELDQAQAMMRRFPKYIAEHSQSCLDDGAFIPADHARRRCPLGFQKVHCVNQP
jgi:hypothetical protein